MRLQTLALANDSASPSLVSAAPQVTSGSSVSRPETRGSRCGMLPHDWPWEGIHQEARVHIASNANIHASLAMIRGIPAAIVNGKGNTMTRRTALALTIGLSSICLLAGNGIGHAQQSDADKVKATIDGFHTAISSLDIRKMDDVWAHEPYAIVVNPRDKTVTVGWDAIRKNFEGGVFQFWSELKVTPRDAHIIHINGATAWATGIAVASGKPKAGGEINAPTFESAVFEKRGDRWLIVSWSAWRVPQ